MRKRNIALFASIALLAMVVILFPNLGHKRTTPQEEKIIDALIEISLVYKVHTKKHDKPPLSISDLDEYADEFPLALAAIRSHECEVVWGLPLGSEQDQEDDDRVLAFEVTAPNRNGWIWHVGRWGSKVTPDKLRAELSKVGIQR